MNKKWLILIIIASITLLVVVGYQFYMSLSGETSGFSKTVIQIENDLGQNVLDAIKILDKNTPIRDEALDNK